MLEGLQWCFCTRCKLGPIFPTCPGLRFCGPRNTFYAHARYLVMVSRCFYGKKHCFYACPSATIAKSILIINVFETSPHKTPQNIVFNNAGVPQKTFYAHARYLVMVSRRFYNRKHCFSFVLSWAFALLPWAGTVEPTYAPSTFCTVWWAHFFFPQ